MYCVNGRRKLLSRIVAIRTSTVEFVRIVATVVFTVASVRFANAFEVLTSELRARTRVILVLALFSFVRTIAAIVIVITFPSL